MQPIKTFIYQTKQIRELETLAQEKFNVTGHTMMQRAGKVAYDFLGRRWPEAKKLTVFCGGGNNGGDGYVLASFAHENAMDVTVIQVGDQTNMKEEARRAMEICQQKGIPMHPFDETSPLQHADVIVDALCGIGLQSELRNEMAKAIKRIEHLELPVLAIDIPSGINADTGKICGTALHATATVTFIGLKLGLLTGSGVAYTGELICHDLQLPAELFSSIEPVAEKINLNNYASLLKQRSRDWHKGLSGHVLVIGGELGYSGAPRMAALAALRVGAGLVSVATLPQNALTMNLSCPEIMCHGVTTSNELDVLLKKADVIVLGPGLGQTDWSTFLFKAVCNQTCPILVDADGLNLLAKYKMVKNNWVLTPHPGEAARLLGLTSVEIQENRLEACQKINQRYGGVCVLKGAGSLVTQGDSIAGVCDKGNPGMATAGMGDILSGVIGGLMAQGIPLYDAAKLGVVLHATAGDLAAKDGERGMIATDLMPYLRRLSNPTL